MGLCRSLKILKDPAKIVTRELIILIIIKQGLVLLIIIIVIGASHLAMSQSVKKSVILFSVRTVMADVLS